MIRSKIFKTLFPFVLLAIVLFFSYHYFLKDYYWNNKTQTIQLNEFTEKKLFVLKKHAAQKDIYSLEMEIKGRADENIFIQYGETSDQLNHQMNLKKGKIDFVNVVDWYHEDCYLLVTSTKEIKLELAIDYRFIGSSK